MYSCYPSVVRDWRPFDDRKSITGRVICGSGARIRIPIESSTRSLLVEVVMTSTVKVKASKNLRSALRRRNITVTIEVRTQRQKLQAN